METQKISLQCYVKLRIYLKAFDVRRRRPGYTIWPFFEAKKDESIIYPIE